MNTGWLVALTGLGVPVCIDIGRGSHEAKPKQIKRRLNDKANDDAAECEGACTTRRIDASSDDALRFVLVVACRACDAVIF
jgi:hypothetical protein